MKEKTMKRLLALVLALALVATAGYYASDSHLKAYEETETTEEVVDGSGDAQSNVQTVEETKDELVVEKQETEEQKDTAETQTESKNESLAITKDSEEVKDAEEPSSGAEDDLHSGKYHYTQVRCIDTYSGDVVYTGYKTKQGNSITIYTSGTSANRINNYILTASTTTVDGKDYKFLGWYDEAGNALQKTVTSSITGLKASTEKCEYINLYAKYQVTDRCTDELHNQTSNKHQTKYTFVDTFDGSTVYETTIAQGSGSVAKFQTLTAKLHRAVKTGTYYKEGYSFIENETEYTFLGWYEDEEGTTKATLTADVSNVNAGIRMSPSTEKCETVTYYAVYEQKAMCTSELHDTANNKHVGTIVFIDTFTNSDGEQEWYQEYGKTTIKEGTKVTVGLVQNFTSEKLTHNNGGYTYKFLGWYDEEGNLIPGGFKDYTHDGTTSNAYVFDKGITIDPTNECVDIKVYAKWEKIKSPVITYKYIDILSTGSGSFNNQDGTISKLTHTFKEFDSEVNGYTFLGWIDPDGNVYQIGEKQSIDLTGAEWYDENGQGIAKELTDYAQWQPWFTVNFYNGDELVATKTYKTAEEMAADYESGKYTFDFDNLSGDYALTKTGYSLVGYTDEAGELMSGTFEQGMPSIMTDTMAEPVTVNFYAQWKINKYRLTIHYVDENGKKLAADYSEMVEYQDDRTVKSPSVDGYTPDYKSLSTPEGGMPAQSLEYTVVYTKDTVVTPGNKTVDEGGTNPPQVTEDTEQEPQDGVFVVDNDGNVTVIPSASPTGNNELQGNGDAAWALLNLICTIITVILSIVMLIFYFIKKDDDEDEEDEQAQKAEDEEEEDEDNIKKKGLVRLFSIIPAVVAVIAFILTEDMSLPMQWTDKWTLLMIIILIVQLIVTLLSKKTKKDDDEEEEETAEA